MAASRTPSTANRPPQEAEKPDATGPQGTAKPDRVRPVSRSRAEEYEPDDAEDQNREPGRNRQKREHRRAGLGLARLGRGFDDLAVSLRCHGDLFE